MFFKKQLLNIPWAWSLFLFQFGSAFFFYVSNGWLKFIVGSDEGTLKFSPFFQLSGAFTNLDLLPKIIKLGWFNDDGRQIQKQYHSSILWAFFDRSAVFCTMDGIRRGIRESSFIEVRIFGRMIARTYPTCDDGEVWAWKELLDASE